MLVRKTVQYMNSPYHTAYELNVIKTRTVRKSDYTPALALQKHMAGIFDENVERKKNTGKNK